MIEANLAAMEAICQPADEQAITIYAGRLAEWISMYGLVPLPTDPTARERALEPILFNLMEDRDPSLPGDLLVASAERIRRAHRFRNLPMPAEITATVLDDWRARRGILLRLRVAKRFARYDPPDVPPELRAVPRLTRSASPDAPAALGIGGVVGAIIDRAEPGSE